MLYVHHQISVAQADVTSGRGAASHQRRFVHLADIRPPILASKVAELNNVGYRMPSDQPILPKSITRVES